MSYSRKKYIMAIVALIAIFSIVLMVIAVSSYFSLRDVSKYSMIMFFVIGFLYYPLNKKLVDWIDSLTGPTVEKKIKEMRRARRGCEGEDVVNAWLKEIVGDDGFLKNVVLPDCDFDIDSVIVCNKGVVAVEVKNFSKARYFNDEDYFYEGDDGKRYFSSHEDPRSEARRHGNALANYLSKNGFASVKINKVVVFANGKVSWDGKSMVYIIKDKDALKEYINHLEIDTNCTLEISEKIKKLLRK